MKILAIAIFFFILSGCATQATMNVYSQPTGAYITEIGTTLTLGIAPTAVVYNPSALEANKRSDHWVEAATQVMLITHRYSITIPLLLAGHVML